MAAKTSIDIPLCVAGLGVSVEAVCKVTDNPLPVEIDELLVQYVEPALTPRRHRCQIESPENEYGFGVY